MVRLKDDSIKQLNVKTIFQFHYGAIKSRARQLSPPVDPYFNSIMVRLKDEEYDEQRVLKRDFNSIMVRLKVRCQYLPHVAQSGFQFHYGAIKSLPAHRIWFTMERFQFHYGAIKSPGDASKTTPDRNFNSIMVRLKADKPGIQGGAFPEFQFHYGAIKSQIIVNLPLPAYFISIPLWCD